MIKGIITGDIIQSRTFPSGEKLPELIRDINEEVEGGLGIRTGLEIFRGDSFQMILEDPSSTMLLAILFRAGLRLRTPNLFEVSEEGEKLKSKSRLSELLDARLSVGIGKVEHFSGRVSESYGEALTISGEQLDKMKDANECLRATTSNAELNGELSILTTLADTIVSRWSSNASEAAFRQLLYRETQIESARALGISQPAIHNRLETAGFESVKLFIEYFSTLIANRYGTF